MPFIRGTGRNHIKFMNIICSKVLSSQPLFS